MIQHRGLLNHLWAKVGDLGLTAADCVAQTAPQTFDISLWQLLAPLLVGGRVHVVERAASLDPERLIAEVGAAGVSVFQTVPSMLGAMLRDAGLEARRPPPPRARPRLAAGFPGDPPAQRLRPHRVLGRRHSRAGRRRGRGGGPGVDRRPVLNTRIYVLDPRLA